MGLTGIAGGTVIAVLTSTLAVFLAGSVIRAGLRTTLCGRRRIRQGERRGRERLRGRVRGEREGEREGEKERVRKRG
jgi:hypothetical protein